MRRTTAAENILQRRLWRLGGQALAAAPVASTPRLYRRQPQRHDRPAGGAPVVPE
jgi:hypothetical protein